MLADQQTCAWCPRLATQDDHIIPLQWGGSDLDRANHHGLCTQCHTVKTQAEAYVGARHKTAPLGVKLSAVVERIGAPHGAKLRAEQAHAASDQPAKG